MKRLLLTLIVLGILSLLTVSCGGSDGTLTIYSGRSEELVGPVISRFEDETDIDVEVRYGDSAELAATILEEGDNSPADVFFAQDPASLGVVAIGDLFATLPTEITDLVAARFSDDEGRWVGVSGRSRVLVYDTSTVEASELPSSEDELTGEAWAGRVAIAPTNGSFLAFVAAKVLLDGEEATLAWLQAMEDNGSPTYSSNSVIVTAVNDGEVDTGLVNHYYRFQLEAELGEIVVANHFLSGGAGSLVMPAGAGILARSGTRDEAAELLRFLLDDEAQTYFAEETFEYPLVEGIAPNSQLPPLDTLTPPELDLSALATVLDVATDLVADAGLL